MRKYLPFIILAFLVGRLPGQGCGWRGDGTGVFPKADPPVEWSEDKHIAWKTPLPNWGNGSPVVGGTNVYVLCEPTEETPAPILVALDQRTGEEVWRATVDHFDAPGGDKKVQQEWHALQRRGWRIMRTQLEYRAAVEAGDEETLAAARAEAKELGVNLSHKAGKKGGIDVKAKFDGRKLRPVVQKLKDHGIRPLKWEICMLNPKSVSNPKPNDHTWCANWAGQTFCAPVADDEHIWVVTGRNAAACFAHDGKRKWLTWLEPRREELDVNEDHIWGNGPFVSGDRMVVYSGRAVYAVAKDTGKLLWTFHLPLKPAGVDGRSFTNIVPITVDGTTHGCLVLDKLYLFDLATGKDLLAGKKWARLGRAHSPGVLGPAIVTNHSEDDDGLVCLKFVKQGTGITAEKLWSIPKTHTRHSPTGWQDRFYTSSGTYDLAGKQVRKHGTGGSRITPALAGGRFYLVGSGRDRGVSCSVVDAKTGGRLATNKLAFTRPEGDHLDHVRAHAGDDRWYYFTMAVPLPHGKALYLRSMDHLYCIRK